MHAEFEGTSIGVRMSDNVCYYNVVIDDTMRSILHGTVSGLASYTLASGLPDGNHTIRLTKRNETNWTKLSFNGFILDDGKNLLAPAARPVRKIEFIGDSFTGASGNEWTSDGAPSNVDLYTNIDEGFGAIIARHYGAQFHLTSQSGYGLVLDWQGNYLANLPNVFDRSLDYTVLPKWEFEQWIPNLVVICLGLNDYNGWGGYSGPVSQDNKSLFESRYHEYISWIRSVYPGTKILAVAAHPDWIQATVGEVVAQEKASGKNDVSYAWFPYYPGGYVNNGHPNVATHHLIADTLMAVIDTINAWAPYIDTTPPSFVHVPASSFTVCDTSYTLTLQTDSYATLRYSGVDRSYDTMENPFTTTGKRDHSVVLSCRQGQEYTWYVRGVDVAGNRMTTSAVIHFTVDTTRSLIPWTSTGFDDSHWKVGAGPLHVSSSGASGTVLSGVTTAYFRKKIHIDNRDSTSGMMLTLTGNDGIAIFINGVEFSRINMAVGAPLEYSSNAVSAQNFNTTFTMSPRNGTLGFWKTGENVIALEVHPGNVISQISFDSKLSDGAGKTYYALGSNWMYSDSGNVPVNQIGAKTTSIPAGETGAVAGVFALYQNYPNPFNPSTTIRYQLAGVGTRFNVTLTVYDVLGREVTRLVNGAEGKGFHQVTWDASGAASGTYFARLIAQDEKGLLSTQVTKMLVLK